jgi:hypothetical protein
MDIFKNSTKSLPKTADSQIVRVPMTQQDLGGRTEHIPTPSASDKMTIRHIPNAGGGG